MKHIKKIIKYFLYRPKRIVWKKKNALLHNDIKVVFLVQYPETWNSMKTVYESMVLNKDSETVIFCIPKPKQSIKTEVYVPSEKNEAYDFFSSQGIPCVNAYTDNTWLDLEKIKPHYVIYTRPYNAQYPDLYKSTYVCGFAKTCYLPYAFNMLDTMFYTTYHPQFISSMYLSFIPCNSRYKMCKEEYYYHEKFGTCKFLDQGFPRFDLLKSELKRSEDRFCVLWMPRWASDNNTSNKQSGFLKYSKSLLEFAKKNIDKDFVIRPHPLMFSAFITNGIMTQEQVDDFFEQCDMCGNVYIDTQKDYLPVIRRADVLVADYTSLLMEFFVTKKPIIYCDDASGLNTEAQKMNSVLYHADTSVEIEELIKRLCEGEDELLSDRSKVISELLPVEAGKIGYNIANYILEDIRKGINYESI